MTVYAFEVASLTTGGGVADATNLTGSGFLAIAGGSSTDQAFVDEIYLGGQATSSAPTIMLLGHSGQLATGTATVLTPNAHGPVNPSSAAPTAVAYINGTGTAEQRSNSVTTAKKVFTFNSQGGVVRVNYANTQDRFGIVGNTATAGGMNLSAFTGTTTSSISAHILYEKP